MGGASNGSHTQTHTHSQCPSLYTGWMEPRARIELNLDKCRRGPPTKSNLWAMNVGRTQCGVGGAGNVKHTHTNTHTHSVPRDTRGG